HEAGVPEAVLQFLPGDGATVGAALTSDPRVAGVAFTGSTDTARAINRALAARDAAIGVLIAETGGQNALIADSSSLPEQVVKDAISSAFTSAGQRCSAARVLFVQHDIADKVVAMLAGAMAELKVGDPGLLSTDVGPVIDHDALKLLEQHAARMEREATLIATAELDAGAAHGSFFAPRAYALQSLDQLHQEVFGPVLHVIRWQADQLDAVIAAINATGYGLTCGVHSRIDETVGKIISGIKAGKTIPDGVAEVREAVDFLRYYAQQARRLFAPEALPGPTGESNTLQLSGRGVFVCISPWNFPLAIFSGQIAAALAAGNSVIAKPAEQTNLIGHAAVQLLHEAGVPEAVLQFLPGDGATVGAALTSDPRVAGVAFTGSTDT
ncbi:MAG: aldehyde dehydrogenase family protein, partial [Gammaproteobacteria bacterium]|nr:aldehyde dehydrogenase family protein [Gammaproteobacteria bacterium]